MRATFRKGARHHQQRCYLARETNEEREWSAEEVTVAILKRATIGHQLLNHVTEFMVDDAIAQARLLDEYFAEHKKLIGPLHGVAISTKAWTSLPKKLLLKISGTTLGTKAESLMEDMWPTSTRKIIEH